MPRNCVSIKTLLLALCVLWSAIAHAEENPANPLSAESVNYGELYMVQERPPFLKNLTMNLQYGLELSDPYFAAHSVIAGAQFRPWRFLQVGVAGQYYMVEDKGLARILIHQLDIHGLVASLYKPTASAMLSVAAVPLSGVLNVFSSTVFNFELALGLGSVFTWYQPQALSPGLLLFLTQSVYFTEHWGAIVGVTHTIDHPGPAAIRGRTQLQVGSTYKF